MLSPLKNLVEFTKKRPPQVICTLCLVLLAAATFSFAFYVRQSDELLNNDAEESWNSLKKYINGLRACLRKSTTSRYYREEESTVAVSADVIFNGTTDYGRFEGIVLLAGWHGKCRDRTPADLKISLNAPDGGGAQRKVCAIISGPESFLPKYKSAECTLEAPKKGKTAQLFFVEKTKGCGDSDDIDIEISLDITKRDDFAVYLSQTDKSNIYVHLLWSSFVMVSLVIVVIVYAMFVNGHGEKDSRC